MRPRLGEWQERMSALVLLAAGLFVALGSRARIVSTAEALTRREVQIERLASWLRKGAPAAAPVVAADLRGLFGPDEAIVVEMSSVGPHLLLRSQRETAQ